VDRKTVEYLGEKVQKAQEIILKIDDLKKILSDVEDVDKVYFESFRSNIGFTVKDHDFLEEIIAAYVGKAEEEIKFLEKQLAEL
jgi:hypothetical protein